MSNERYQELYSMHDEDCDTVPENPDDDIVNSLANCLTVHRIPDDKLKALEHLLNDKEHNLKTAELVEKKNLADDYEAIVKKQLQLLQADERGRIALEKEIEEIKRRQQNRSEALKARKKVLMIEKARAKKMASRPAPLPKSVVKLLKEQERKEVESCSQDTFLPPQNFIEEENDYFENDENIFEEESAENKKKREEWDKKAKLRFNEAIKRERQNKENTEILKEIQNAEKVNRRHIAKTISTKGGNVPCQAPDNMFHSSKQVAMENKVERIFKKNPKEHAVEDLEGYEDRFEAKYREIDSNLEARLIDCVPSFVKENYNYLLEDESTLNCGRRFTGFQNDDMMNMGFIVSPPSAEDLERSEEVEDIINTLNKMHQETNEMIEKDFKPLLKAKGVTKVESIDKAVEADILRMPTEHKSVEVSTSDTDHIQFEPENMDIMSGGVMNFKRRPFHPVFEYPGNARTRYLSPPKVQQDFGKVSGQESWSSSSYWSLPSKHGMPKTTCNLCDSPSCKTPLVEHQKSPLTCIPLSKSKAPESESSMVEESIHPGGSLQTSRSVSPENNLSHYVRIVAKKYLKSPKGSQNESRPKKYESAPEIDPEVFFSADPTEDRNSVKFDFADVGVREMLHDRNPISDFDAPSLPKTKSSLSDSSSQPAETSPMINMNDSAEDSFLRKCKEVISDNLFGLFRHEASPDEDGGSDSEVQAYASPHPGRIQVYHELSTIQEMDSALTNDSNHTKRSLERRSVSIKRRSSSGSDGKADLSINTTPISLIEDPPEEVSNLVRSIKFTEKKSPLKPTAMQKETASPNPTSSSQASDVSVVSSLAFKLSTPLSIQTCSVGTLTPSSVSTQPSPMSVGSQGVPYAVSSPFRGQPATLMSLPKYFQDLSSIRKGSSSSASSVTDERNHAQYSVQPEEKLASYGVGSFAPMTARSEFSSLGRTEFYPMSQISNDDQAGTVSSKGTGFQSSDFQPMTPLTGVSKWYNLSVVEDTSASKSPSAWNNEQTASSHTPVHFGFETDDADSPHSINSNRFHYLTPHTYLPSLTASSNSSKTATPSQREFNPRGVDEPPTPELTSPFDFYPSKNKSSSKLKIQLINSVRSPLKSGSSPQPNLSLSEVKSFVKQNISSDICLPTSQALCTPVNIKLNFQTHSFLSHKRNSEAKGNFSPLTNHKESTSPTVVDSSCRVASKVVGSEPFLPTLTAKDYDIQLESNPGTQMGTPVLKHSNPLQVIQTNDNRDTACVNVESPSSQSKVENTGMPPGFHTRPLLQVLKNSDVTGLSSQHNTPYRSTIQTPSKTLEEMMMETGILNEPDLTLVNSEFTINPGSPEKPWRPENNLSCSVPLAPFERSVSVTPARNALLGEMCDSPSMMSFLQHEQSCLLAAESTDEGKEVTQNQLQVKVEASPRSAKKRTPWNEYKSRTKRLWNNLEEVKEKKIQREKREAMLKNRMKMKEYSKKLHTPKK